MTCEHEPKIATVCAHVVDDCIETFTGRGNETIFLCATCVTTNDRSALVRWCQACVDEHIYVENHAGEPEIIHAPHPLALRTTTRTVNIPALDSLTPFGTACRDHWFGISPERVIYELVDGVATALVTVPPEIAGTVAIHVSPNRRFLAVTDFRGTHGTVFDLVAKTSHVLTRDGYHSNQADYPFAFVGTDRYIHSPRWNRLDLCDAATGACLTERTADELEAHHRDYFHGGLTLSPDGALLYNDGWVWGADGMPSVSAIEPWLAKKFETEDGPSLKRFGYRAYAWNLPHAWLSNTQVISWGYGRDIDTLVRSAEIYDALSGKRVCWFGGVSRGKFHVDGPHLLSLLSQQLEVWNVDRGALVAVIDHAGLGYYHPAAKLFVSNIVDGKQTIGYLAGHHAIADARVHAINQRRDAADLPILADLLEQLGAQERLTAHCRESHTGHTCWVFDRIG
ncbi:MAG: hypothetical protein QM831_24535 [Kofleriaceae bacterium]